MIARTSSTAWVRGVVDMFRAEGVDAQALFRDAALDIAVLDDPVGRFSIDDVSAPWEMAVARSGKATIGLSKELAITPGNFGLVRNAMMACPKGGERPVPRQRVEFGMLTVLTSCSWFTGRELVAEVVEFVYPDPVDPRPHHAAFGCPVRFCQPANRALLRKADLALPLSARDTAMLVLHERLADEELERLEGSRTSHHVLRLLKAGALHPEPRREQVAAALSISDRTLQRRLQTEATSFQQLLDETRRELAQQYLRKRNHSLKLVAELLGFEDQSNLHRACRRWFGESPGQYRARLCVDGAHPVQASRHQPRH